jgi:hypothetical protein
MLLKNGLKFKLSYFLWCVSKQKIYCRRQIKPILSIRTSPSPQQSLRFTEPNQSKRQYNFKPNAQLGNAGIIQAAALFLVGQWRNYAQRRS